MKKLVIFLCLTFVLSMVQADPEELASLQNILQQTRGTWTADNNCFSELTAVEQEELLGLLPGIFDMQNLPDEVVSAPTRITDANLRMPAIRNQGSCGSCYSFGASACYEGRAINQQGSMPDLSEQWFMMEAKRIGPSGGCNGWYLDTSMNLMQNVGVADERQCGYRAVEGNCASGTSAVYRIGGWSRTTDQNTIQAQINSGNPVYVGFAVYSDFSYYSSGYYKYTSGSLRGYHAVAVVGYDTQGFNVRNSWGSGWGESGNFRILYSEMRSVVQFGTCFGGSYYITR